MKALVRFLRIICWIWLLLLAAVWISGLITAQTDSNEPPSETMGLLFLALPAVAILYFVHSRSSKAFRQDEARLLRHTRGYTTKVVGVSFRQNNLVRLAGSKEEHGKKIKVYATLVCEFSNPKDPNAVAVFIDKKHIGYLPREEAEDYRHELKTLDTSLPEARAMALISGGWKDDDSEGDFGVKLNIKRPLEWAQIVAKENP